MGRFNNGNYYRSNKDAELQWLEDGANVVGRLCLYGFCALFIGMCQIVYGLFKLASSVKIS